MMMDESELAAEVSAVNLGNAYANELYPLLRDFFTPLVGTKIVKADGSLLAKLKLPEFPVNKGRPGQHKDADITTYKYSSDHSLAWVVKVCWPITQYDCTCYDLKVYIGEVRDGVLKEVSARCKSEGRTDYTVEEILGKVKAYEAAKKVADDALRACYPFDARRELDPFDMSVE
jgi:hypothetical protein